MGAQRPGFEAGRRATVGTPHLNAGAWQCIRSSWRYEGRCNRKQRCRLGGVEHAAGFKGDAHYHTMLEALDAAASGGRPKETRMPLKPRFKPRGLLERTQAGREAHRPRARAGS